MGLFNQKTQQLSERQQLESRYNSARTNILLILAFTVINIVLAYTGMDTYFLFSAFIPYMLVLLGLSVTGKMPAEFYDFDVAEVTFADDSILVIASVIAAVICGLYLLCWLMSKKGKVGWLIAALVLFVLDTILMFSGGIAADSFLDVAFHLYVVVSLGMGIYANAKLKKLPPEEPTGPELPE